VLVIDHDMSFVEALNGYVTVLHQGQILAEGTVAQIRADEQVTAVYLGRSDDAATADA
jgi:urea transport system ATP-binding protein